MSFIDFQELKGEVDIKAACSFLQLDLKSNGKQLRGLCPHCEGSGERSLVVTPEKGAAYCFNARKGGDVIWLTSHIRGVGQKEAALLLAAEFLGEMDGLDADAGSASKSSPDSSDNSSDHTSSHSSIHISKGKEIKPLSYLQADHKNVVGLGVLSDTAEHFECGHAPKGIMRGKLAIPIHDGVGRLLAYCGRSYEDGDLVFPSGFEPEYYLFNANRIEEGDLYLTRDPLEVLLAYENGVENVVSLLTNTLSPKQLRLLAQLMEKRGCEHVELIS